MHETDDQREHETGRPATCSTGSGAGCSDGPLSCGKEAAEFAPTEEVTDSHGVDRRRQLMVLGQVHRLLKELDSRRSRKSANSKEE